LNNVIIRKATLADSESVYNLICQLEEQKFDKTCFLENFKSHIERKENFCFVAEENGVVIAYLGMQIQFLLHHCGKVAEIQELVTDNHIRSKGIGGKLLEFARKTAREENCIMLELSSNQNRTEAHRFYAERGMKKTHVKFTEEIFPEKTIESIHTFLNLQ
jgi:(aminoalkyl)phosphonate N-acetyltransferase